MVLINAAQLIALALGLIGCILVGGAATARGGATITWGGAALGLALFPAALSLWTYLVYGLSSWAMPGVTLYISGPAMLGLVVIARNFRVIAAAARGADLNWRRSVNMVLFLAAFGPVLAAIILESATPRGAGDISQYLSEASALSTVMRAGFSAPLDWLKFGPVDTAHPHSLSWTLYLAWGFLGSTPPGFDTDALPRALIGFAHLSVMAGIFSLLSFFTRGAVLAACFSISLLLFDPSWKWELAASSRDTFYVGPLLVMVTILTKAGHDIGTNRSAVLSAIVLFSAVYGAAMGHSIGVAYAATALLAISIAKMVEFGKRSFFLPELWLTTFSVAAFAAYYAVQYLNRSSGQMGYEYFYYRDPALMEHFMASRPFFRSTNVIDVVRYLLSDANVAISSAVASVGVLVALVLFGKRSFVEPATRPLLTLMLLFWVTLLAMVMAPVKLDGITLASALVANFRYSLGLRIYLFLMAPLAIAFLWQKLIPSYTARWKTFPASKWALFPVLGVVAWGGVGNLKSFAWYNAYFREVIDVQLSICREFAEKGGRRIYVDSARMIYRCGERSRHILTAEGSEIIAQRQDADFERVLAIKQADMIVMHVRDENWEKTVLYAYLDRHWHKDQKNQRVTVFTRRSLGANNS